MNQRGYIPLPVIIYGGIVLAVALGLWYVYDLGGDHREADIRLEYAEEKARRVELISGLALEMSARAQKDVEERVKRDSATMAQRNERESQLKNYVPTVAGSDSCIRTGWVRYTNAAAAGMPLGLRPLPGFAEAPAGVGTDTVAGIVARNYDKYHDCKARVEDILKDFDTKRASQNSVIDRINKRIERAERKVQ